MPGHGEAIDIGHLDIQKDQVVPAHLRLLDSLPAILGDIRLEAERAQDRDDHLLVDRIVLHHKDAVGILFDYRMLDFLRRCRVAARGKRDIRAEHPEQLPQQGGRFPRFRYDAEEADLTPGRVDALQAVRAEEDDRHLPGVGDLPQRFAEGEAVHSGHEQVDDRRIKGFPSLQQAHGFLTRGAAGHLHAPALGLGTQNGEGAFVVIHGQQAATFQGDVERLGGDLAVRVDRCHLHGEEEGRAFAHFTGDRDPASHQLNQSLADDQSQPGTALGAGGGGIDLTEGLEEEVHLLVGDANARIADGKAEFPEALRGGGIGRLVRHRLGAHLQADFALGGKLDGVSQEVKQDLPKTLLIAEEGFRDILMDEIEEVEMLLHGSGREEIDGLLDALAKIEGLLGEGELSGLDLGKVQDVVNDGQERLAAMADGLGVVELRGGQGRVEQEVGHPDDAVHRGADFVAHVGQELGFGPAAGFRHVLGLEQPVLVFPPFGDVASGQGVDHPAIDFGPVKGDFRREAVAVAGDRLRLDMGHHRHRLVLLGGLPEEAGRGEEIVEILADHVLDLVIPEARGLVIGGEDMALLIGGEDSLAYGIKDGRELPLGGGELPGFRDDQLDHWVEDEEPRADQGGQNQAENDALSLVESISLFQPGFPQELHPLTQATQEFVAGFALDVFQIGIARSEIALRRGGDFLRGNNVIPHLFVEVHGLAEVEGEQFLRISGGFPQRGSLRNHGGLVGGEAFDLLLQTGADDFVVLWRTGLGEAGAKVGDMLGADLLAGADGGELTQGATGADQVIDDQKSAEGEQREQDEDEQAPEGQCMRGIEPHTQTLINNFTRMHAFVAEIELIGPLNCPIATPMILDIVPCRFML